MRSASKCISAALTLVLLITTAHASVLTGVFCMCSGSCPEPAAESVDACDCDEDHAEDEYLGGAVSAQDCCDWQVRSQSATASCAPNESRDGTAQVASTTRIPRASIEATWVRDAGTWRLRPPPPPPGGTDLRIRICSWVS